MRLLAEQTPASSIGFDLLALDDDDLTERPLAERRAMLERALADVEPPVHITPVTGDLATAQRWFQMFEGAGLDGLIAKPLDLTYQPDTRVMFKIKHERRRDGCWYARTIRAAGAPGSPRLTSTPVRVRR